MASGLIRFVAGVAAGAVVGVIVSLATAPRSGRELRQELTDDAEALVDDIAAGPAALGESVARIARSPFDRIQEAIAASQEAALAAEDEAYAEYQRTLDEAFRNAQLNPLDRKHLPPPD